MPGRSWKTWLLLVVLTVRGSASLPHRPLTFGEAVELGVAVYNSQAGEDAHYRLLEAIPQPEWDPNSDRHRELNFTLKETVCREEDELSSEECDFREDGVVRQCRGYYFFEERPPVVVLTCATAARRAEEKGKEEEEEEEEEEEKKKEEEKDQPRWVKRFKTVFQGGH